MPRLHVLRIILFILLIYTCLIGLWLFLPSPTIRPAFRSYHIGSVLTSGSPLTLVYRDSPTLKYGTYRSNSECDYLGITYQLSSNRRKDELTLHIDELELNLTDYALKDKETKTELWTSETLKVKGVRMGSTDHTINMPWFHTPDAILFHNVMHGFDTEVSLRVLVSERGVVEMWKDSEALKALYDRLRFGPSRVKKEMSAAEKESGVLMRFKDVPTTKGTRAEMGGIKVTDVHGELVSRTFGIRMRLLGPLGPVPTIVLFLIEMAVIPALIWVMPKLGLLIGVYAVGVWIWWMMTARPPLGEWIATRLALAPVRWAAGCFGLRRGHRKARRRRTVWSATGPVEEDEEDIRQNGQNENESSRSFGKRMQEIMKGVRVRNRSVDLEESKWHDSSGR